MLKWQILGLPHFWTNPNYGIGKWKRPAHNLSPGTHQTFLGVARIINPIPYGLMLSRQFSTSWLNFSILHISNIEMDGLRSSINLPSHFVAPVVPHSTQQPQALTVAWRPHAQNWRHGLGPRGEPSSGRFGQMLGGFPYFGALNHPTLYTFSIETPWFWDTPILGNLHLVKFLFKYHLSCGHSLGVSSGWNAEDVCFTPFSAGQFISWRRQSTGQQVRLLRKVRLAPLGSWCRERWLRSK